MIGIEVAVFVFFMLWCLQRCSAEGRPGFPDGWSCLLSYTIWLSAPASHTCSPSYHHCELKHSGLLSTCCQIVFDSTTCGGLSQSPCSTSHHATQPPAPLPPASTPPWTFRASFHQHLLSKHNWCPSEPSYHASWLTAYSLHLCLPYLRSTCIYSFVTTEPLATLLWAPRLHLLPQPNQQLLTLHSTRVWWKIPLNLSPVWLSACGSCYKDLQIITEHSATMDPADITDKLLKLMQDLVWVPTMQDRKRVCNFFC